MQDYKDWTVLEKDFAVRNILLGCRAIGAALNRTSLAVRQQLYALVPPIRPESRAILPPGFRWAVGYTGRYSVNEDGIVLSHSSKFFRRHGGPTPLAQRNSNGYRFVSIVRNGDHGPDTAHVARLVLEAFGSECPPGHEVDHIDHNRSNNHISNLRWVTHFDNMQNLKSQKTKKERQ